MNSPGWIDMQGDAVTKPYIVALGGTTRVGSSTQKALAVCLREIASLGGETHLVSGTDLDLPPYTPGAKLPLRARNIVAELRRADGVILGTPGYHGGISGLVKNALDYVEELRTDERPYLEGRAVGCVVTAAGEQGAVSALLALRSVVHALRGFPTPLGAAIVTAGEIFDTAGKCLSEKIDLQLKTLSRQVLTYAVLQRSGAKLDFGLLNCPSVV
jgi:FMN reductase